MAQQNIDFGTFPDDPDADAIRTAFQKVQNNFSELYTVTSDSSVTSVNRSSGSGITVNSPTGNVVVSANVYRVEVSTSTLSIGIGANNLPPPALYISGSQTLVIDKTGNISMPFNSEGMFRAYATADKKEGVFIYKDEK
jgi:hypothetical protein